MNLFRKETPPAPEQSGTDFLRLVTAARVKQKTYARIAASIGCHGDRLIEFAENRRDLPPDLKKKLAAELYPNSVWDEASDKIVPKVSAPPHRIGPLSPPWPRTETPPTVTTRATPMPAPLHLKGYPGRRSGWA